MSPFYPKSSIAERVNRNLKSALTIFHNHNQREWDRELGPLAAAMNSAYHEAIKMTPASLFLNRELNHPLANVWQLGPEMWQVDPPGVTNAKWETALKNLKESRAQVAKRYNLNRPDCPFKEGQLVLCRLFPLSSAVKKQSAKLMLKWTKPLCIAKFTSGVTVDLSDPETGVHVRKAHITHLKAYNAR